jgi:predicted anti-sigma-YlaC factor YlaD
MISRLVDLELKATTSSELFEHLGRCAQCREFYDTMMKLSAELDKIGTPLELSEATSNQRPYVGLSFVSSGSKEVRRYSPDAPAIAQSAKPRNIGSSIRTLALAILIIVIGCVMFSTTISVGARGASAIQTPQENGVR